MAENQGGYLWAEEAVKKHCGENFFSLRTKNFFTADKKNFHCGVFLRGVQRLVQRAIFGLRFAAADGISGLFFEKCACRFGGLSQKAYFCERFPKNYLNHE